MKKWRETKNKRLKWKDTKDADMKGRHSHWIELNFCPFFYITLKSHGLTCTTSFTGFFQVFCAFLVCHSFFQSHVSCLENLRNMDLLSIWNWKLLMNTKIMFFSLILYLEIFKQPYKQLWPWISKKSSNSRPDQKIRVAYNKKCVYINGKIVGIESVSPWNHK